MGARFIGIEEALRNRIIKYIFGEQLKRRQEARRTAAGS
jgi:c-di-GMP-binding flagellar brake protein YcgR